MQTTLYHHYQNTSFISCHRQASLHPKQNLTKVGLKGAVLVAPTWPLAPQFIRGHIDVTWPRDLGGERDVEVVLCLSEIAVAQKDVPKWHLTKWNKRLESAYSCQTSAQSMVRRNACVRGPFLKRHQEIAHICQEPMMPAPSAK